VCGGRDFDDYVTLRAFLNKLHAKTPITEIIEGGAKGADALAAKYADKFNIPLRTFKADWDNLGKKAGPIRNSQMLKEGQPDLVVAFPTPKSVGTLDMINKAKRANVQVITVVVKPKGSAGRPPIASVREGFAVREVGNKVKGV